MPTTEPAPDPDGADATGASPKEASRADASAPGAGSAAGTGENADVARLSYEQARDELTAIVARLEAGQAPLEESMGLWRRGEALAAHCTTLLDSAQAEIDRTMGEDADD